MHVKANFGSQDIAWVKGLGQNQVAFKLWVNWFKMYSYSPALTTLRIRMSFCVPRASFP
jgi:hypothetical protein